MLDLLLPGVCALCHEALHRPPTPAQLCEHCLAALPWNPGACPRCAAPAPSANVSHACFDDRLLTRTIAPLRYEGHVVRWVLATKRHSGLRAAELLGALLGNAVASAYVSIHPRPTLLLPVPLSLRRLVWRGHNQAALIAAAAGARMRVPVARRATRRVRHTPIQPGLGRRARAQNLRGAFVCRQRLDGAVVAIVDDVVTTGATAHALAPHLLAAGAREVHLWSAARAEQPGNLVDSAPS